MGELSYSSAKKSKGILGSYGKVLGVSPFLVFPFSAIIIVYCDLVYKIRY